MQAERDFAEACAGVNTQSLPINGPESPVSFDWMQRRGQRSAHLVTDVMDRTHPCGREVFTWLSFMNHVEHGGGALPRPDRLTTRIELRYERAVQQGSIRLIAGFQGWWNGQAWMIEIHLHDDAHWGDAHPQLDIIYSNRDTPGSSGEAFTYLTLDGSKMAHPVTVTPGSDVQLELEWNRVLAHLVARGRLDAPRGGWAQSASTAVSVSTEVRNDAASHAAKAELWVDRLQSRSTDPVRTVAVHRLYDVAAADHVATLLPAEAGVSGYEDEGALFRVYALPSDGRTPLFRCFVPSEGDHFVSTSPQCEGATREGRLGFVARTRSAHASRPLHRCFSAAAHDHLLTTEPSECRGSYSDEGIVGYVP